METPQDVVISVQYVGERPICFPNVVRGGVLGGVVELHEADIQQQISGQANV